MKQKGNQLLAIGVFSHVTKEHLFENAYLFYRFDIHEKELKQSQTPSSSKRVMTAILSFFWFWFCFCL